MGKRLPGDPGAELPLPPPCRQLGGAPAPGGGETAAGQGSHAWGPTGTRFSPRISAAVTRCLEYFSNAVLLLLSPGLASCPVLLAVYETIVGIMRWRTCLPHVRPRL